MATILTTFESMTAGSAPSATEGVFALGTTTGMTVAVDDPWHGAKDLKLDGPTMGTTLTALVLTGGTPIEFTGYLKISAAHTADMTLAYFRDSASANAMQLMLRGTSFARPRALALWSNKDAVTRYSSTVMLNDAAKRYRIGVYLHPGTSTTTGSYRVKIFDGDNTTELEDTGLVTSVNVAAAVGAMGNIQLGKPDTNNYAGVLRWDSIRVNTGAEATQTFAPYTPAAATPVAPLSVLDNTGTWALSGTAASIPLALGDASDTTLITSPGAATDEAITLRLAPLATGNIALTYRLYLPSGSTATQAKVELLQGTTVVATRTHTLTSSAADYTMTLSGGENTAVTDRTLLRLRVTGNPV